MAGPTVRCRPSQLSPGTRTRGTSVGGFGFTCSPERGVVRGVSRCPFGPPGVAVARCRHRPLRRRPAVGAGRAVVAGLAHGAEVSAGGEAVLAAARACPDWHPAPGHFPTPPMPTGRTTNSPSPTHTRLTTGRHPDSSESCHRALSCSPSAVTVVDHPRNRGWAAGTVAGKGISSSRSHDVLPSSPRISKRTSRAASGS